MPSATTSSPRRLAPIGAAGLAFVALAATCARRNDPTLTGLCEGRAATQRIDASIDTVLPHGGAALAAMKGRHFALRLDFSPPPATGPAAGTSECQGAMGEARFSGELPEPLRSAASRDSTAAWRIEGDTVLVDLNPKTRDNNVVMSLPMRGGRGHWALSTFAGEAARGVATSGR